MGASKAALEWHGSTLLRRAVGILGRALDGPIVVVRAVGQALPELPGWVEVLDDRREGRGPLEGIATGLAAVCGRASVAYVSATDLPLLHPAFVRAVVGALGSGGDSGGEPAIALPSVHGHRQPLAAAYRTSLASLARVLATQGAGGPARLLQHVPARELDAEMLLSDEALAAADPRLCSVINVNEPEAYLSLHARPEPEVAVLVPQGTGGDAEHGIAGDPPPVVMRVRAATLGRAAGATGLQLSGHASVRLNGAPVQADPQLPLVAGDVVSLAGAQP